MFTVYKRYSLLLATVAMMQSGPAMAQTGRDFAAQAQQVHFNYDTLTAKADMTITRGGSTAGIRSMTISLIEKAAGDHDLGRIDITAPNSLAGTMLLSWSDDRGDDQQWLSTANANNTRRIGDRGRKATFVNSDFSFEDLLKWQIDGYSYDLVGPSKCPAGSCTQVRATPATRSSGYGALLVDYDSANRISQIQYFRKGSETPWKALTAGKYRQVGTSWQPGVSEMRDLESGSVTRILWSDYHVGAPLDAALFQPN